MTQLTQFFMWQLRDIGRSFKEITIGGVFAILLGAQVGHLMFELMSGTAEDCIVLITLPATLLLMCVCIAIQVQWNRFKRDQEKVIAGLKE